MNAIDHLSVVDSSKINWNVRVRVTRIWPSRTSNGVIVRHNLLLLDSENTHIRATTTPDIWIRFQNIINEGSLCIFRNFRVIPANGIFRPVHHPVEITLLHSTIVNVLAGLDTSIAMHKFDIIPLGQLQEHVSGRGPQPHCEFSAYVIGVVEDLEPIHVFQTRDGPVEAIRFQLFDERVRHKVRIWGPLNPDATALYDNQFVNPKIVILASTRISEYKGIINITTLSSTKIYINLACAEVENLRHWLINDGFLEFWPVM